MEITEVKVFPARDGGRLKAYATIVFDNCFIVRDLKVIEGHKGLFVSMPSRKRKDGTFKDVVHPLNADMRETIERMVIDEYNRVVASGEMAESEDY
jgi:stage V sporulation protein G